MSNNHRQFYDRKYSAGFNDGDIGVKKFKPGLSEAIVKEISKEKNESPFLLEFRLAAYKIFINKQNPKWAKILDHIDFNEFVYYLKATKNQANDWDDVPQKIKDTFKKLGIPEAEQKFLSGVNTQYDSESVYHSQLEEITKQGVIFLDTDTAWKKHPELLKKYFGTIVPPNDNKYSALNSAVWSGGTFIYVPKGVVVKKPLQSYFRINATKMGQFERTLIIVEEGGSVEYVEGCTAPVYSKSALHAAIVEIYVSKNARCKYTTIQNWSNDVYNLVTKRAYVEENGFMEWIDGNIGSKINMKYPSCILAGKNARGTCISIAVASKGMLQDAGAKMIHLAPNTSSQIISKSVAYNGGSTNYRGLVRMTKKAVNSKTRVDCDTLLLDGASISDTIPTNIVRNASSTVEHEASITKLSKHLLFYMMSKGLDESTAKQQIILGFISPFMKELPMEYAVELNALIKLDMEGSVG